jgi:phosphopentomutase
MHGLGVFLRAFTSAVTAMPRAFLFVMDSFGVGGAPDAAAYGDEGADTLGHIAEFCAAGAGDREGLREGPLTLPNLSALGLLHLAKTCLNACRAGMPFPEKVYASFGAAKRSLARQGHTVRPLGDRRHAGYLRLGLFPTEGDAFPPNSSRRSAVPPKCPAFSAIATPPAPTSSPAMARSTSDRQADLLHFLGLRLPGRRPREAFRSRKLMTFCSHRPRLLDRQNIGRVIARPFVGETPVHLRPHRQPPRLSPCRRPSRRCSTGS